MLARLATHRNTIFATKRRIKTQELALGIFCPRHGTHHLGTQHYIRNVVDIATIFIFCKRSVQFTLPSLRRFYIGKHDRAVVQRTLSYYTVKSHVQMLRAVRNYYADQRLQHLGAHDARLHVVVMLSHLGRGFDNFCMKNWISEGTSPASLPYLVAHTS